MAPVKYICVNCKGDFNRPFSENKLPLFCCVTCKRKYAQKHRTKPPVSNACAKCGKTFTHVRAAKMFCSTECQFAARDAGLKKECAMCGVLFSHPSFKDRTCSQECAKAINRWAMDSIPKKSIPTWKCERCGKHFQRSTKKPFCSVFCERTARDDAKNNSKAYRYNLYPGWGNLRFECGVNPFDAQINPFDNPEARHARA